MNTANGFQHTTVNDGSVTRGIKAWHANRMLCFDALQITSLFSSQPLSNQPWACDTGRRSYKAWGCSINLNPHRIQRLQGSSIIHAWRRWTDWIVTSQAGMRGGGRERNELFSFFESWAGLAERATPTHPKFTSTRVMWLIFALSDPKYVCMSNEWRPRATTGGFKIKDRVY